MGMPLAVVTDELAPKYTMLAPGEIISIFLFVRLDEPTLAGTAVVLTVMLPLLMALSTVSLVKRLPFASEFTG